jgi:hypothetical protein
MLPPHPRTMPHADPSIELSLLPFGQEALTMFRFVSWRSGRGVEWRGAQKGRRPPARRGRCCAAGTV